MSEQIRGQKDFTLGALAKIGSTIVIAVTIGSYVYSLVAEPKFVRAFDSSLQEKLDRQWVRHVDDMDNMKEKLDLKFSGLREFLNERFDRLEKK